MFLNRRGYGGLHIWGVPASRRARGHRRGALAAVASMAELVVMKTACELCLLQVSSDVLVWHLLKACLEQIGLLCRNSLAFMNASQTSPDEAQASLSAGNRMMLRTSSSLHARPPPVDAAFLFFVMPNS